MNLERVTLVALTESELMLLHCAVAKYRLNLEDTLLYQKFPEGDPRLRAVTEAVRDCANLVDRLKLLWGQK